MGLVAEREIRDRMRGRMFRYSTLLVLVAVVLAVVIPTLVHGGRSTQTVAVVGGLPAPTRAAIQLSGRRLDTTVQLLSEPDAAAADADLRAGRVQLVIVDGQRLRVHKPIAAARGALSRRRALSPHAPGSTPSGAGSGAPVRLSA